MPQQQPDKGQWQFDRTISIGHLLTTLSAIAAVIGFGANMNTRLSLVEQAIVEQRNVDSRQDSERTELRRQIREDLLSISNKIDRVNEKLAIQGAGRDRIR